jgi:hypothetical protein
MLSSFINRRKVKKTRTPLEDQENPRHKLGNSYSKNHASVVVSLRPPALHRQSSPKVYLDFTPSGSNDWFPPEILAPLDEDSHLPIQPVPESSTSPSYDDVVVIGHAAVSFFRPHPSRIYSSRQSVPLSHTPARPYLRYRFMTGHPHLG